MSTLEQQIRKIFRHTRQGSYATRSRYLQSCLLFARYLHIEFKLQNIKNIHDRHLVAYIRNRQAMGISGKTIKNDLAAIRYCHDHIAQAKYKLAGNDILLERYDLFLEKVHQVNGNRAWAEAEYEGLIQLANREGRDDIAGLIILCRRLGFRITEGAAMSRAQAEQAIRTGSYQVRGEAKSGKWREIPLCEQCRLLLQSRMRKVPRGGRMFIPKGVQTHRYVAQLENWLINRRGDCETRGGQMIRTWERDGMKKTNDLTWHGLRYLYVQDRAREEGALEETPLSVAQKISRLTGHNRVGVTQIYGLKIKKG